MSDGLAREILAAEYEANGRVTLARLLRSGQDYEDSAIAIAAIANALSRPHSDGEG